MSEQTPTPRTSGDGEPETPDPRPTPLALVHGLGTNPIDWQDVVSRIGAGRPMAAPWVDGLKPTQKGGFDLDQCASAVLYNSDVMTWREFDVVGQDVGGMVAATLAADHPEKVRRVVLSGVLLKMPRMAVRMQKLALQAQTRNSLVAKGIDRQKTMAVLDSLGGLDLTDALRRIEQPTLVLVGENDRAGGAMAKEIARLLPDARLEKVPGAGRRANVEAPEAFAEAVTAFTA
ncbi:alpha/beta fold hydrolase [Kytococcus sp. Marseille-QA3725]